MKTLLKTLALSAVAVSAVAGASADVRSASINISDIDLSSRSGVETLNNRIEAAAEDVCARSSDSSVRSVRDRLRVRAEIEACMDAALEQAGNQLDGVAAPIILG